MKRRTVIFIVGLFALLCVGWLMLDAWPSRQVRKLPDGTTLSLEGVKIGRTNIFFHGTAIEKFLKPVVPYKGFRLWGFHVRQTQSVAEHVNSPVSTLTLEFKQESESPNRRLSGSQYRVVIAGDDGFEYVTQRPYFASYSDGYFGYISTATFPRDSRTLHISFKERAAANGPWKSIAEFTHRQHPVSRQSWKMEAFPIVRESRGTRVTFADVAVLPTPYPGMDVWNHDVLMRWQVTNDGTVETNWRLDSLVISDTSGNRESYSTTHTETNGWFTSRLWQTLDPRREWKIKADVSRDSGFAASNIFTVRIPGAQVGGVQADCGSNRVHVGFASFNALQIDLLDSSRTSQSLKFIRAVDGSGNDVAERGGMEERSRLTKPIKLPLAARSETFVTFAIDENIPVEFIIRPRQVPPK